MKTIDALTNIFRKPDYESKLLLGEALLKDKVITVSQLQKALDIQRLNQEKLGKILIDQGHAKEQDIIETIEKHYDIRVSSLSEDIEDRIKRKPLSWRHRISNLRMPISVKFAVAITFTIWLTVLVLSFVILQRQKEVLYQQTLKVGKISLRFFTNNARIPLVNDDTLKLNTLIKEATSVEGLLYAIIVDREQVIKAHTDPDQIGSTLPPLENTQGKTTEDSITYYNYQSPAGMNILNVSQPVTFMDKVLGAVNVGVSLDFIREQTRKATKSLIILSLLIITLGISTAIFFGIGFSRPIYQLVLAAKEIASGNYEFKIDMVRRDELGDLASAFNYMSHELWKKFLITKSFGQYVSPEVLNIILANPEESWLQGSQTEATILFADVRGFTRFAEKRKPEEVVESLNEYFRIVTRHILEHGGYIDKFVGDAVLGVFCIPIFEEDHAERAVRAAMGMQQELISRDSSRNPLLARIGIGINSGTLVAGNLGSDTKIEYTVIGDTVNIASRITDIAGPGKVLISKNTLDLVTDLVTTEKMPSQKVKGKSEPVEVYQVLGINEPDNGHQENKHEDAKR